MKKMIILTLLLNCENLKSQALTDKKQNVYKNQKGEKITEEEFHRGESTYKVSFKGDVYLKDTFEIAKITMKGGKEVVTPICFNTYKNEILALIENEKYVINDAEGFTLGNHQFIKIKGKFYEVILEKNNLKLLKLYKTDLIEDNVIVVIFWQVLIQKIPLVMFI